jgi:putative endonuclease
LARRGSGRPAERRALWHYRLRGFRILGANVWLAGCELDLIVRRGRSLVFVEVKSKSGSAFGSPEAMVDRHKQRRLVRAAETWLARHPDCRGLDVSFEVAAVERGRVRRVPLGDPA